MAPALVATRAELDELVDKTRRAVERTAREIEAGLCPLPVGSRVRGNDGTVGWAAMH